jgi:hypothetical protein
MYKVLLVYLAYNITSHASLYKVNINDKLISLGLDTKLLDKVPEYLYLLPAPQPSTSLDGRRAIFINNTRPTFLYVLGFFIGDGSLHLKLEWREKDSTIVIVPMLSIRQSNIRPNKAFMELITSFLNSINIKTTLEINDKTTVIVSKGIENF